MNKLKAYKHTHNVLAMEQLAFYALLAEAFFVALVPAAAMVALLVGVALWLVRWLIDRDFVWQHLPCERPLLAFCAIAALSVLVSPDPAFSFYNYTHLVGVYLLTYLLASQVVTTETRLRLLVRVLAYSCALVVAYGFWQFFAAVNVTGMKWTDGDIYPQLRTRVFSTWQNPNILAGYLDEAICLAFAYLATFKRAATRLLLVLALLALTACLAMTYARGAILAIVGVFALYGLVKDKRVLFVLAAACAAVLLLNQPLAERLLTLFSHLDTSAEMRLALWESSLAMVLDHPLLGIGWGAYFMVYPAYDFYIHDAKVLIFHAHNLYLNYAAETGVFGAAAFLWWLFGALRLSLAGCVGDNLPHVRAFRLGVGLALVSVALGGLTDDVLFNTPTSMLLWLLVAVALRSRTMRK